MIITDNYSKSWAQYHKGKGCHYDLIVVGGGAGGVGCACKAARLGKKVALIEKQYPGGEPINKCYYPVKAIIEQAKNTQLNMDYESLVNKVKVQIEQASLSWERTLTNHLIDIYKGEATFAKDIHGERHNIRVHTENYVLTSKVVVLATGTKPDSPVEGIKIDGENVFTHEHILNLDLNRLKELIIIGGDVEGCEFASLFNLLGVTVTVLEKEDKILPNCDEQISYKIKEEFENRGINVMTGVHANNCTILSDGQLKVEGQTTTNQSFTLLADKALVTGKRVPVLPEGIPIAGNAINKNGKGLKLKKDGTIEVTAYMETSIRGVYAIGDIIGAIPSANAAIKEGRVAAYHMAGKSVATDYSSIPFVFFTIPQTIGVGMTEQYLIKHGIPYDVGIAEFRDSLRSLSLNNLKGFVKALIHPGTKRLLGLHIIGEEIAELSSFISLIHKQKINLADILDLPVPHPTLGEMVIEAINDGLKN